eukprot:1767568-Rhodomonas_salina.2
MPSTPRSKEPSSVRASRAESHSIITLVFPACAAATRFSLLMIPHSEAFTKTSLAPRLTMSNASCADAASEICTRGNFRPDSPTQNSPSR